VGGHEVAEEREGEEGEEGGDGGGEQRGEQHSREHDEESDQHEFEHGVGVQKRSRLSGAVLLFSLSLRFAKDQLVRLGNLRELLHGAEVGLEFLFERGFSASYFADCVFYCSTLFVLVFVGHLVGISVVSSDGGMYAFAFAGDGAFTRVAVECM
jgi:hypothetical protein